MDRKGKGKQIATGNGSSSTGKKRKNNIEFRDEGLRIKRKKPEVLQFFEESAEVGYYGESSDEECDIDDFLNDMEDEGPEMEATGKDDKGKQGNSSFVFPKEEEIDEEEYDKMMEERYKPGSGFVRYADDDVKSSIEMDRLVPTAKDPPIWKVKCAIGRERHAVFCLMTKFVEMRKIGNKLQILSVFSVEHLKGFIFIEAEKEHDILEACKGLNGIYATRMVLLPKADAPHLLCVQKKTKNFSEGTWARVKNGIYKGDLAKVVAVNDTRGKALIKLIPRIDVQALTQKYGGGVAVQKGPPPAPRLISSSELEEFRPLIQVRRDRDTGLTFEHLDSLMLKDGYLYKKVSLDSLSSWGVVPSKEEILKFAPVERKETGDVDWISEIYGGKRKEKILPTGRRGGKGESSGGGKGESSGGGKGEGSPESNSESSYELYNLVCFSRKEFGLIVGVDDKGDGYKVLKESPAGPVVVTVGKKEMQNGPFDSKFTALDLNNKQISVNDVVKISKGPSEGKQGVVRQVYRGVIFLYAESEEENGGYFCCKSQMCEKVKLFTEEDNDKTGGFDASAFGDFGDSTSSPKSPLSPEKEWQPREKYINSNQGDKGSMYSIGQKLRIRVGPWKGYLCRVIALRYSDITVKLDTQQKPFIFKSEHLAEVRDRNTVLSTSADAGSGSFQPFDMLGTEGSSGDWAKGAGTSGEGGEGGNWNTGGAGASTDWNSWGSKPTSDVPTAPDDNTSTWGQAPAENNPASTGDQPGGWDSWGKKPASDATVGEWGVASSSKAEDSSWGKQGGSSDGNTQDASSVWGKIANDSESGQKKEESSWGKKVGSESGGGESCWGNKDGNAGASNNEGVSWGQQDKGSEGSNGGGSAWGNQGGGFGKKDDGGSSWGKKDEASKDDGGSSWGKKDEASKDDGGSSWGKKDEASKDDGGSSWGKKAEASKDDRGSSWGKKAEASKDDGGSSWGKKAEASKDDGGSSWGKKAEASKDDGGSSWGKKAEGGSSWGKTGDGGSTWGKKDDGGSSWGKTDEGGSTWAKREDGGSTWGKKDDGGYSEQTFDRGGRGFGGRRGGGPRGGRDNFGRGGRDNFGRGGRSFNNSEEPAPWSSKSGGGSSWGKQEDSGGGGSTWGKQDGGSGGGSAWGKQNETSGGTSWGKQDTGGGGSTWGKQDGGGGGGSAWGKQNDAGGGGGSAWGKQNETSGGGGSGWGNKQDGGGGTGSTWGKQNDAGGGGGSSWGNKQDGGGTGSTWGKQESGGGGSAWGKQDGGGGSSWSKQSDDSGSKPWNEESGGGFGGRRGRGGFRGGFRGGRDGGGFRGGREGGGFRGGREGGGFRGGRGRGGYDRDNQDNNTWKSDQGGGNTSTWKSDQSGGNTSTWKSEQSSGGGGNWSSWGTNSKKEETNDKPGNENKALGWGTTSNDQANTGNETKAAAWGATSNDQANTGNETKAAAWGTSNDQANTGNDAWNKKSNDVVAGTSGGGGWGAKTDTGTSSGWGTGTGDKKSGW